MNTAVINIKTDSKIKKQAQKVAGDLGFSLSSLINGYLKQLVRTKGIQFSLVDNEEPSDYLVRALHESETDVAAGWVSPALTNATDAIAWLNNPKAGYKNGHRV